MNHGGYDDDRKLRRYLLGQLDDPEQQKLEERLFTDDELFELLSVIEDELIDDYLDDELSADERTRFDAYFLCSPERHRQLRLAMAFKNYITAESASEAEGSVTASVRLASPVPRVARRRSQWRQQLFASPYFRMASAAVIVLGLGFGIWRVFFFQSEVSRGSAALAKAYRIERPVEARITGLNYAPLADTRGSDQSQVDELSLNRAERILLDEVSDHPTSAAYHALGRFYLAESKFDKAIAQFEEALKGDPNNAQLHSDYGAALLEKGKVDRSSDDPGKGLEELARSLDHLNKALELNSELLDALFNRALVHQEMMLPRQAEEDWQKYLEKDASSQWAAEVKRNLNLLEERKQKRSQTKEEILRDFLIARDAGDDIRAWQVVSHSREAVSGKLIWEQLLDAYLEAATKGDRESATGKLQALSYMGELEAQRSGDLFTSRLADFYTSTSATRLSRLAQARSQMISGRQYYFQAEPLKAVDAFGKIDHLLDGFGDDAETLYTRYWLGCSYLEQGNMRQGIALLEQLAQSFDSQNFKWLLMRTLQSLSGAQYGIDQYSKGIDYCRRALALAENIGDTVGVFNTASMLTWEYCYIANYRRSLSCGVRSLAIMDSSALNEVQISRHFHILASTCSSYGLHSAAIDYEKEVLRRAVAVGHPQMVSLAYEQLGALYGRAQRPAEALMNTELAYGTAKSNTDPSIRAKMMASSLLQMGHLYRETKEFEKAIGSYDECIRLYETLDLHYDLYQAHKGKLFCCVLKADDSLAKEELETTLNLFKRYRSGIVGVDDKNRYFDIEQSVYDLAIDFAYLRENDPRSAFDYSEQSRSGSLLDSVAGKANVSYKNEEPEVISNAIARPLELADLQQRLPEQTQVIQYAVLNDKLLIWVVSKREFAIAESKIGEQELSKEVISYVRSVSDTNNETREDLNAKAKVLFDILIKPCEPLLDKSKTLCVVPDKVLNYFPFAALISPETGRFLLEDYSLIVSPSSSLLVACSEAAKLKEGAKPERLLSVGNPGFDRREFPSLRDLPSATREAKAVAAYYSPARLLLGESATEERVKSELVKSDVVHLALHSVMNERSPMLSKLVLAREQNQASRHEEASDGVLQAYEIYELRLPRTRVVVLSACQTGVEGYYKGEGMISMARPFMAAGVPLVVASLWPVDSDSTAELMISFHKHRKLENLSSAEALRRAQLDMLNSPDARLHRPYCWAPFIAVGGRARF